MDSLDSLIISLLDSNVMKGAFIKELAGILNTSPNNIIDVSLHVESVEGVITQILKVELHEVELKKENLMQLPFKSIYGNVIIFEVGDIFL